MKTKLLLREGIRMLSYRVNIRQWIMIGLMMIIAIASFSQGVKIGTGIPDPSAVLDITSINKGFLIPRMTTEQRLAINLPPVSLLVFDNTTSTFWYHHIFNWTQLKSMWIQNGDAIYNSNAGNVGIGLTNPAAPLDVNGTIRAQWPGGTPNGSYLSFGASLNDPAIFLARGNGSGGVARNWDMKIDDDNSFRITDNTSGQLRMTIDVTGGIGIGISDPHPSAALDITSTTQGFLTPRMTKQQREAIALPATGLLIWCSDCGPDGQMNMFDGTYWTDLLGNPPAGFSVGDSWAGGIVAYIFETGDPGYISGEIHGLIAAENDLGSYEWGCYGVNLPGCEGQGLGTGNQNTIEIVSGCVSLNTAAKKCSDLVLNGYSDWFLPSWDELVYVENNKEEIGGFMMGYYWTSTEHTLYKAYAIDFSTIPSLMEIDKDLILHVRPIRNF